MVYAAFCLTVVCLGLTSEALKLPSYISPCVESDPMYKECVVRNGQIAVQSLVKGDRKYRFPAMDPFEITAVSVDDRTGPVGVKIALQDVKIYGFPQLKVEHFGLDRDKKMMHYTAFMPRCEMLSKYNIEGKILILPVVGQGDANFTLSGYRIIYSSKYELITKPNGKVHMVLTESKTDFTVEKAVIRLNNLFNGDKLLGDQVNLVMNDNWQVLITEIGTPVVQAVSKSVQQGFDYILDKVAMDDIFPQ